MIPDLGKYASDVLAAYAVALFLIICLVGLTLRQSAKSRAALKDAEHRARK